MMGSSTSATLRSEPMEITLPALIHLFLLQRLAAAAMLLRCRLRAFRCILAHSLLFFRLWPLVGFLCPGFHRSRRNEQ